MTAYQTLPVPDRIRRLREELFATENSNCFARARIVTRVFWESLRFLLPVPPLLALAGTVAAPVSIALSATALVMSHNSLRRFWLADHRYRWHYTAFIAAMWILLLVGIGTDVAFLLTR